jgi:hypothetical protein
MKLRLLVECEVEPSDVAELVERQAPVVVGVVGYAIDFYGHLMGAVPVDEDRPKVFADPPAYVSAPAWRAGLRP